MWSSIIRSFSILVFSLCFLHGADLYAVNDSIKKTLVYDSSGVVKRSLTAEQKKELFSNSDYKYDRVGPAPVTAWDRFKQWFWHKIGGAFESEGGRIGFRIFGYVLIIAAILLIIYLLLKNNIRALFYGKSANVTVDFAEFKEDIHLINFDAMITEALSKKDFRKAIRLHFLKLLKELSDKNHIRWQPDKTNNDYSAELSKTKYSKLFSEAALLYEYVWYGDFGIDEHKYSSMALKFKEFKI